MGKNLKFLKISSVVVKVAAWIFFILGAFSGITISMGLVPAYARWMGFVVLTIYGFIFFFFFLVAKMADLLGSLVKETKEEQIGGEK
ncbi:MAG: hypothetical protein ABIH19_02540 [Candidatus Omnitrophota bacterium]